MSTDPSPRPSTDPSTGLSAHLSAHLSTDPSTGLSTGPSGGLSPGPAAGSSPDRAVRTRSRRLLAHLGLIAAAFALLYPLLWLFASSARPDEEIFSSGGLWPRTWDLANYAEGWRGLGVSFRIFFENSFVIAAFTVAGNLFSCTLAAYAFARLDFALKKTWFAVMLATMMLPHHVTLIPQYTAFNLTGFVNSFYPLFLPHFLAVDGFFVFLLVQFIRGMPIELDEAARVDGCGAGRIFWYVILPQLKPALVTTTIFSFLWSYNDFFAQLIYLNDTDLFTVPLGLRMFLDATGESSWGPLFAMSVLALVPAFVLFLGLQRYITEGIATTGLKG
ncbi:carbohydrate ABC transporter permease [Nonomuraea sp. K274]|uniref:Carbohydrate ABC transporter permease n=1 Tax=Nonomuraea cypriaca TaxID=1187855 RepID=A0A931AA22_9ACTN|nr:carbohydrate ABC transporter permease [Nonomuraea cypriaca]MBF8186145.1 carbohydrate ABC transporter permease [Nonomuraea cypriaca]